MGYSTDFSGEFALDRPLTEEHADFLKKFAETRRMKRDAEKAALLPDPTREQACLPIGTDAGYFVGGMGFCGQDDDASVINSNRPPDGQPGLWCQWIPTEDNTGIEWDGEEKFYNYVEWLQYIIDNFLKPWGYVLSGEVEWYGEDRDDMGKIVVTDNTIKVLRAEINYVE